MRKVAVTGGLSSGKTTVCQFFKNLGACVISADEVVHRLISSKHPISERIAQLLGAAVLVDGQLDRKRIASTVFSHPQQLAALEAILHPVVFAEIEASYRAARQESRAPLFVAEIPLLYETKQEDRFDCVIVVEASESVCRSRFLEREKSSGAQFSLRMNRQLPLENKVAKADYVIHNQSSLRALEEQVKTIYSQLTLTL